MRRTAAARATLRALARARACAHSRARGAHGLKMLGCGLLAPLPQPPTTAPPRRMAATLGHVQTARRLDPAYRKPTLNLISYT